MSHTVCQIIEKIFVNLVSDISVRLIDFLIVNSLTYLFLFQSCKCIFLHLNLFALMFNIYNKIHQNFFSSTSSQKEFSLNKIIEVEDVTYRRQNGISFKVKYK